jgi:UDP-glucose 4-epimerase
LVVLDDLYRGHRAAVDRDIPFYQGAIGNSALVELIVRTHGVDSCIHFAALAYVGESMIEPARYFENNCAQGIAFLNTLIATGVKRIVFSSTCATYGNPQQLPIAETHPQQPLNPYGWSKLLMERLLESYDRAYGLRFIALRYFNAAGATNSHGEHHEPETHLIPNVLRAASGRLSQVTVFGTDYPTPDGTAIRDYIHVADLGTAHSLALQYLADGGASQFINLGNGIGFSVSEVIEAARRVTGRKIDVKLTGTRPGDPHRLVAESDKAKHVLGWTPTVREIETILRTAWVWCEAHPHGYSAE